MNSRDIINKIESLTRLKYKYCTLTYKGGDVLEPTKRFAEDNIYVVDFKRFYPHIIIMNNIFGDKLSKYIKSLLESSINDTGEAKKQSKLILNTIYGMMKHFDFNGTKKTAEIGRNWIRITRELLKHYGYEVLSSDTDSVTIKDLFSDEHKLNVKLRKISEVLKMMSNYPLDTFELAIENKFKYIYFFPNATGFKKKQYCAVRYTDEIVLKSRRLNFDEQVSFKFIADCLRQGKYQVNVNEFIKFAEEVKNKNETFININNINIIGLAKPKVLF